jgi:dolichol kinase
MTDPSPEPAAAPPVLLAPTATRHDLQLGRRFFHLMNGVSVATAYAIFFTHTQIIHVFGTIACLVYVFDRVRIAYPEIVARYAPAANRLLVRAEEQVRESAMTPYAIAVLLTILTVPKPAALIAIYTLAIADPASAVVGISWGRHKLFPDRSLEGTLAFFGSTLAIAMLVLFGATLASMWTVVAMAFLIALAAGAFDLVPLRIDDNLTIPLFVGFVTWIIADLFGVPLG